MTTEYRIMGCRDRLPMIAHLCSVLGISSEKCYVDMEMNGNPLKTQLSTLSIPFDKDTSHIVLIQDDCLVGSGFKENVETLIGLNPDCIYSLYIPDTKGYGKTQRMIVRTGGAVCGLANIIPIKYIEPYIRWWNGLKTYINYRVDDATLAVFAKMNNIEVYTTVPSIVEHRCNDGEHSSALNHAHGMFTSVTTDIDADVKMFAYRKDMSLGEYNGSYLQKYIRR